MLEREPTPRQHAQTQTGEKSLVVARLLLLLTVTNGTSHSAIDRAAFVRPLGVLFVSRRAVRFCVKARECPTTFCRVRDAVSVVAVGRGSVHVCFGFVRCAVLCCATNETVSVPRFCVRCSSTPLAWFALPAPVLFDGARPCFPHQQSPGIRGGTRGFFFSESNLLLDRKPS